VSSLKKEKKEIAKHDQDIRTKGIKYPFTRQRED